MTAVVNMITLLLAVSAFIIAVYFALRAFRRRGESTHAAYNVGQVEARRAMQVDFIRAGAAFIIGLIMLGVAGLLNPFSGTPVDNQRETIQAEPSPVFTPTEMAVPTEAPPTSVTNPTPLPSATAVPVPATPTPLQLPTETAVPPATDTPQPTTATVQSGVGVWLRSQPTTEGEQIEWLLDGTILELMPGYENDGELEWQQVRAPSGNEGWVAVPFIVYNE